MNKIPLYVFGFCVNMYAYSTQVHGLTCACGDIQVNRSIICQCDTEYPVRWFYQKSIITTCITVECLPKTVSGYVFSYAGSKYQITILNYSLDQCEKYICKDLRTSVVVPLPFCPVPVNSVTIIKPSTEQTINITEGNGIEFKCQTSVSYPAATIYWYKDGSPRAPGDAVQISENITSETVATGTEQEGITTSTLQLYPSKADKGLGIFCSASNTEKHVISQRQPILNVMYSPSPLSASNISTTIYSRVHSVARFDIVINANPDPIASDFVWSKNERDKWRIIEDSILIRIVTKPPKTSLVFTNVQNSDFGEYLLEVNNEIGKFEQKFFLISSDAPSTDSVTNDVLIAIIGGSTAGVVIVASFVIALLVRFAIKKGICFSQGEGRNVNQEIQLKSPPSTVRQRGMQGTMGDDPGTSKAEQKEQSTPQETPQYEQLDTCRDELSSYSNLQSEQGHEEETPDHPVQIYVNTEVDDVRG